MASMDEPTALQGQVTEAGQQVLTYIENTFENASRELHAEPPGCPKIVLRRITSSLPPSGLEVRLTPWQVRSREVRYRWPGKTLDEAWKFTCLGKILAEIYIAISDGVVMTKRDIYYRDPQLFKRQETVDRYVDDIAFTCGVTRKDLNVVASPKGLVCGFAGRGVELTPDISMIRIEHVMEIRWMLVVEKEATFSALVERNFHDHAIFGKGLLVTGKGYPDLKTRRFLRNILDTAVLPILLFGIFDGDPDGLDICKCYTVGSLNNPYEAATTLPELTWLGVDFNDLLGCPAALDACPPLTDRDRNRIVSMLNRAGSEAPTTSDLQRDSLQQMLMLNRKAELQALDALPGGFCYWLTGRMQS